MFNKVNKNIKKSQVTIFIIIGILILIILSIFIIIATKTNTDQSKTNQQKISQTKLSFTQFNSYLQTCFDNSLKEGLYILGKQGGFFFKDQPGSIIDFDIDKAEFTSYEKNNKRNKKYNITYINDKSLPLYVSSPPDYPCFDENNIQVKGILNSLKGIDCKKNYSHSSKRIQN